MGKFIDVSDLTPFAPDLIGAKGEAMIDDAEAHALLAAPCLSSDDLTAEQLAATKAILRGAILRWNDSGDGATTQLTAGPFSKSITPQARRNSFWPSEIKDLQRICKSDEGIAFAIDTAPSRGSAHLPWCSLSMGANYCSCGVDIAGIPIYELG